MSLQTSAHIFIHLRYSYNYFDPDNYIATYALLQTGYPYLHEQVKNNTKHDLVSNCSPNAPLGPTCLTAQRRLHQRQRPTASSLCRR
jgi:hypothetical protein